VKDCESLTHLASAGQPMETHELFVEDLEVYYRNICALSGVSFRIGCGHCVGLLGQNGAGKSTLMKSIAGLIPNRKGQLLWCGRAPESQRGEIAYLPQVDEGERQFPMTVRGLVELGRFPHLGLWKRWRSLDDEVVDAALETLKLQDLQSRRLFQLSGGQLQRAHIARALAQEAHVLLLDEPFAGLDEPSQQILGDLFHELAGHGRLLLVCHHDLKQVPELFDHVLLLNREQVAFGPTEEVFTPENLERCFAKREAPAHV